MDELKQSRSLDLLFFGLRLAVVAAAIPWAIFAPLTDSALRSLLYCLVLSTVFGIVLWALVLTRAANSTLLYRITLAVDVFLVFWAVRATGNGDSIFILGFYTLVGVHAFREGLGVGVGAAAVASVLLLLLPRTTGWGGDTALRISYMFLVAIASGLWSTEEKRNRQKIQGLLDDLVETRQVLGHAEKAAMLGTLSMGIAHEVNNPASAIISRIERVLREAQKRNLEARTVRDLEVIHKHAMRIGHVLSRLLSSTRLTHLDRQIVSLNDIIEGVIPLVESRLREKQLTLNLNLQRLPPVSGDPASLEHVILNILNNAIDAAYRGTHIYLASTINEKGLELTVTDLGIGIKPEDLPRIFDPFFTTKAPGQGTGLGLYVAYQILRHHSGEIAVSSETGKGTAITITLPAAVTK